MVPELTELTFYYMNLVTVARVQRNPTAVSYTHLAGDMGEFTITKADDDGTEIVLGEPLQFTPENVADYAKLY